MALITSALTSAIVAFAVTSVPILFSRKSKRVKVKASYNGEKTIDYASFVFWVIYGGGAIFSTIGVLVYWLSDEPIAGIIFLVLGLILLLPTLLLQFVDTSINWSSEYISGAKSGVSLKKNRILWEDIVSVESHPNQTIELKDSAGKSVVWSVYYNGWHEIITDLQRLRPDIDTSSLE